MSARNYMDALEPFTPLHNLSPDDMSTLDLSPDEEVVATPVAMGTLSAMLPSSDMSSFGVTASVDGDTYDTSIGDGFPNEVDHEIPWALPQATEDESHTALLLIAAAEGDHRAQLVADFLKVNRVLLASLARRQCRTWCLAPRNYYDDVYSITQEEAWKILHNIDTAKAEDIRSWPRYLSMKVRTRMRVATESPAWTGLSGGVSQMRRYRALDVRLRAQRNEIGRNLTEAETKAAIDDYNDDLLKTRVDASRQGALVTIEDLKPLQVTTGYHGSWRPEEDAGIAYMEMSNVLTTVIAVAYRESADLGLIAQWYYNPYLAERSPSMARVADIVAATGLNRMKVSRALGRIQEITRDQLAEVGIVKTTAPAPAQTGDEDENNA